MKLTFEPVRLCQYIDVARTGQGNYCFEFLNRSDNDGESKTENEEG